MGPLLAILILSVPLWSAASRLRSYVSADAGPVAVPILVYHSVAPTHPGQNKEQRLLDVDTAMFRQQMDYLVANKYTVVPLSAVVDAVQGHGTVPSNSVAITFDDGWLTQYQNALPILEQLHFPATFFIITHQVGLGTAYMGLDQLKALQRAGMTIASHTQTHPDLSKVSATQLRNEVVGSRQDLQRMLGVSTDLIAYPYGCWNNRVAAVVKSAGYRAARALGGGISNSSANEYALHSVLATDDMAAFVRELHGSLIGARDATLRVATSVTSRWFGVLERVP
ncbi:MAG TPA: polysaccharide deacetylase family protein [Gemmatimonadaceae bacterium]